MSIGDIFGISFLIVIVMIWVIPAGVIMWCSALEAIGWRKPK